MPPRILLRPCALCTGTAHFTTPLSIAARAGYASASATTPAPHIMENFRAAAAPIRLHPPTQPPSHKPPELRKTQLHRQYQSLLRSSPLILIFQYNNMKAVEFMSIRRELAIALRKLDATRAKEGQETLGAEIKLRVIQTNIFASALRVVEFFNPESEETDGEVFTHGLSPMAHEIANNKKLRLELEPILFGPLAVLAFPFVSPQYLKTALSVLSPSKGDFPAPSRKANPDYYEPAVQQGLQKLMLLGARVEGKVFDIEGIKWVGGIDGGIDGLRAQLVHMLQGIGGSLTSVLEGASRSLYMTVEGRRMDMEEKEKGPEDSKT